MEDYDWESVDPDAQEAEELRLPRVTWYNGNSKMKAAGGIIYTGGMTARRESLGENVEIQHWAIGSFEAEGKTIETLENANPVILPIRYRRRWAKFDGNTCQHWFPITGQYEEGYKIQVEIAGFIKGHDAPVRFDLRGHASTAILDAMRDHAAKLVSIANKNAPQGKALPSYAFWLRLKPGKHEMVGKGKQSEATLPQLLLPSEVNADYVRNLYVGRDMLVLSQAFFHELDGWAKEWSDKGASSKAEPGEAYEVPEYAGEQNHAKAATAAAWGDKPSRPSNSAPSDSEPDYDDRVPF